MQYPFYSAEASAEALGRIVPSGWSTEKMNPCALSCVSMLVERLMGLTFPPENSAEFALRCGAVNDSGMDFSLLSGAIAGRFSLRMRKTNDLSDALDQLGEDCLIIVRAERDNYLLITGRDGNGLRVLDPCRRKRKGAVKIKPQKKQNESEYYQLSEASLRAIVGSDPVTYVMSVR